MLKKFSYLSLLYGASAYILAAFVISQESRIDIDDEELWMSVFFVFHGTTQIIYTVNSRKMLSLVPFKELETLDDFMTQSINIDSAIVQNNGLMKTLCILSTLGCLVSVVSGAVGFYQILEVIFSRWNSFQDVSLVFITLAALGFGIPTIIYNLRTFGLRCIAESPEATK